MTGMTDERVLFLIGSVLWALMISGYVAYWLGRRSVKK